MSLSVFEKRKRLDSLLEETRRLQREITDAILNCKHVFGPAVYDPEETQVWNFSHYKPHGSDPYPIGSYSRGPDKPRWRRECTKCPHVEYTDKTKVKATAPDFS